MAAHHRRQLLEKDHRLEGNPPHPDHGSSTAGEMTNRGLTSVFAIVIIPLKLALAAIER
jgi:hypothetical protein